MKIPAILIKSDFYSKGRNVRWIQKHGYQAVPILQCVWIASSQERECKILKEDAYYIPFLFNFPKEIVIEILESAVSVGLLDSDETHYWNSQIVSDSNRFKEKHNNYKEGHKKRLKNQDESKMNSSKIHPKSNLDFIDTDTEHDTDHVSDISSNKEQSEPLELPPQLESPEMRQALGLWQKRCIENGRPLTQATLEAQMMQLATEPIRLRNAFIFSASLSKCFNLREPPEEQKGSVPVKVNKSYDKAMELLKKERDGKRGSDSNNGNDRSGVPKLSDERGAVRALGYNPKPR